jgi:Fuc2NAc and GlcNAc transferase
MNKTTILCLGVFLLSALCAPLVLKIMRYFNVYDTVNERSSHKAQTPRGGGLSFILALAAFFVVNLWFNFFPLGRDVNIIFAGAFVIAAMGLIDDNYSLPFLWRLIFQFLLVLYPALHLPLFNIAVPGVLQHALYAIAWVWFINLFNFMDGTNGFACQEAIFLSLFLVVIPTGLQIPALAILFSVLAFLPYNFPKARIFMGDSGSTFLGYLLGGFLLIGGTRSPHYTLAIFSGTLLFTADATYTLIKRVWNKENISHAHRSHWYQRMYNMGCTHSTIFLYGVSLNVVLLLLYFSLGRVNYIKLELVLSLITVLIAWSAIYFAEKGRRKYNAQIR